MDSEPVVGALPGSGDAPPVSAQQGAKSESEFAGGTNDGGTSRTPVAAPATKPPEVLVLPDTGDDQATVLDLRREQLPNGTGAPPIAAQAPDLPQPPHRGAEPIAHDAATYQDAPPGTPPVWRTPSAPPYVPPQPQPRPQGMLPATRSHAPWRTAQSWGPTTFTVSADTTAGFSYLLWWLTGLVVYFAERNNRYVRFHALQAILLTSVFTVAGVVVYVLDALLHDFSRVTHWAVFGALGSGLAVVVVVLGIVVPWLFTMIGAWTGHHIRWPIVGAYAERYAAPPLHIPGSPR
ncbi:MAG TPA: hypothetical protein VJQ45_12505 [Ktedonobacterales bacterium]|nr:hypothetical protein [Ktedonobacterales bacterium]